jgi:hypothetical protein
VLGVVAGRALAGAGPVGCGPDGIGERDVSSPATGTTPCGVVVRSADGSAGGDAAPPTERSGPGITGNGSEKVPPGDGILGYGMPVVVVVAPGAAVGVVGRGFDGAVAMTCGFEAGSAG